MHILKESEIEGSKCRLITTCTTANSHEHLLCVPLSTPQDADVFVQKMKTTGIYEEGEVNDKSKHTDSKQCSNCIYPEKMIITLLTEFSKKDLAERHDIFVDMCRIGFVDAVMFMLPSCDPCVMNSKKETGIHASSGNGHIDVVDILLKAGADIDCTNHYYSMTPLQLALSCGQIDMAKYLLNSNASVTCTDKNGVGLGTLALREAALDFLHTLLMKGANIINDDNVYYFIIILLFYLFYLYIMFIYLYFNNYDYVYIISVICFFY
eukprot:GHVR01082530.1.p1 GENE.GHVR01082530.1~~GHVR01082530.1.p1  ORF type:complete len:266 (+),score=54.52 GHVR01082530.1:41-838(+)